MGDSFSGYHPIIKFFYFLSVLLIGMFVMHPVFLGVGFVSAFIYSGILSGWRKAFKNLLLYLPFILIVVLINPMFNHYGVTILFYLDNGNPITLESIVYGFVMGAMLITALVWFSCYNQVMTSDKFIYLFGRILPSLSLILSMVLRFVPKFSAQIKVIRNAQKCMGRDMSNGNINQKAKYGIKILSILITWALENAIDTADSMRARGYGLKGRTAFSIYRFDRRDAIVGGIMVGLLGVTLFGLFNGCAFAQYNPVIKVGGFSSLRGSVC